MCECMCDNGSTQFKSKWQCDLYVTFVWFICRWISRIIILSFLFYLLKTDFVTLLIPVADLRFCGFDFVVVCCQMQLFSFMLLFFRFYDKHFWCRIWNKKKYFIWSLSLSRCIRGNLVYQQLSIKICSSLKESKSCI